MPIVAKALCSLQAICLTNWLCLPNCVCPATHKCTNTGDSANRCKVVYMNATNACQMALPTHLNLEGFECSMDAPN